MLDAFDCLPSVALVPISVEGFGHQAELDDKVAGQVLRLGLAPFLAPQADQGRFITAHDDAGVRAADEIAAVSVMFEHHVFAPEPELVHCTRTLRYRRYNVNSHLDNIPMNPIQLRMARAAVGWGVRELAEKAGITANTVTRIENGADAKQSTMDKLRRALEEAGVEFTDGDQPGVRLTQPAFKSTTSAKVVHGKATKTTQKRR